MENAMVLDWSLLNLNSGRAKRKMCVEQGFLPMHFWTGNIPILLVHRSDIYETKITFLPYVGLNHPYACFSSHLPAINLWMFPAWCSTCCFSVCVSLLNWNSQLSYFLSLWLFIKAAVLKVEKSHGLLEDLPGCRRPHPKAREIPCVK